MRKCICLPVVVFLVSTAWVTPSFGDLIFDLPSAVVPGTAASGGPSFVLPVSLSPTDTLRAFTSGTVDFDADNGNDYSADWNAAGVVVRTRSSWLMVGGTHQTLIDAGWYRLALGNESLGFFPLFETSATYGLGSDSPPEVLLLNRLVGDVFTAPGFSGLPAGTVLRYRIFDSPTGDNTGAFIVSLVPEPTSALLLAVGAIPLLARRPQLRNASSTYRA